MIECKVPINVTLPGVAIPIYNNRGIKIGIAMQTSIRGGMFAFQPKLKGALSRKNYDVSISYTPVIMENKIQSITLKAKYIL